MRQGRTWALTDHLCRGCGGRILRCVAGGGYTPAGNPLFKCADCGQARAATGPQELCWCGFSHKHNRHTQAYMCAPYSILGKRPELLRAFRSCGCDPDNGGEVGIMLVRDLVRESQPPGGQ